MIYLDPLCAHGFVMRGRSTLSCHMWSDGSIEELVQFAATIGLKRQWLQRSHRGLYHFDVVPRRREAAIKNGAVAVSAKQAVQMWHEIYRRTL